MKLPSISCTAITLVVLSWSVIALPNPHQARDLDDHFSRDHGNGHVEADGYISRRDFEADNLFERDGQRQHKWPQPHGRPLVCARTRRQQRP